MAEPKDNLDGMDRSKLEALRAKVRADQNPEFDQPKSSFQQVEETFQQLSEMMDSDPDSQIHRNRDIYKKNIGAEVQDLQRWIEYIKAGREVHRLTIHPSSPYIQSVGEAPLVGCNLNYFNNYTPSKVPFFDRLLAAFDADVPNGKKLSELIKEREDSYRTNKPEEYLTWTFRTRIPGVALHVGHQYPLRGMSPPTGQASVKLAFRKDLISDLNP